MPCGCKLQFCVNIVLLAICKPCVRFRGSLYRFQLKSSPLSSGLLGFPRWGLLHHLLLRLKCFHMHTHIILASCWLCIAPCLILCHVVFLCWVEPGAETENEVTTEVEFEEPSYDPIDDSTGKMTWPRYHYYLCLLLDVSLFSLLPRCPCLFVSLLL